MSEFQDSGASRPAPYMRICKCGHARYDHAPHDGTDDGPECLRYDCPCKVFRLASLSPEPTPPPDVDAIIKAGCALIHRGAEWASHSLDSVVDRGVASTDFGSAIVEFLRVAGLTTRRDEMGFVEFLRAGAAEPTAPTPTCDCRLHVHQVCDICQGWTGNEKDGPPSPPSTVPTPAPGTVRVELTDAECSAIVSFWSYGATRGNHSWTKEGGEGTGPSPGPLTPSLLAMSEVNRKVFEARRRSTTPSGAPEPASPSYDDMDDVDWRSLSLRGVIPRGDRRASDPFEDGVEALFAACVDLANEKDLAANGPHTARRLRSFDNVTLTLNEILMMKPTVLRNRS